MNLVKYGKTAQAAFRGYTNGGILYLLPDIGIRIVCLIPLLFLWRVLAGSGVDAGMTLPQLLSYTYVNAIFAELLVVQTMISAWNYDGQLLSLFARPVPIFGQVIAHTVGGWGPRLLLFALPMLAIAPLLGIDIVPKTPWFFPSLLLCIALGFAVDFIFACVTIRMRGMAWLGHTIRMAIVSLFSGSVIPFEVLPFGLSAIFEVQPFGSLGGAPLALFVGSADPARTILWQVFWNLALWPVAILWFRQSKERQVSYGG